MEAAEIIHDSGAAQPVLSKNEMRQQLRDATFGFEGM